MKTFLKICRYRKSEIGINAGEGFTAKQNARRLMYEVFSMMANQV